MYSGSLQGGTGDCFFLVPELQTAKHHGVNDDP